MMLVGYAHSILARPFDSGTLLAVAERDPTSHVPLNLMAHTLNHPFDSSSGGPLNPKKGRVNLVSFPLNSRRNFCASLSMIA